jgi:hypothetical protein
MGPDGIERTIRVIYDPDTQSIITRTITTPQGDVASNSFDLQRQAFLAVSSNDPALRWLPDGDQFVVGKAENAHIPAHCRDRLVTRNQALDSASN